MHYPEEARMHLLAYLFGLSYYIVVPITLAGPLLNHSISRLISDPGSIQNWDLPLLKMIFTAASSPSNMFLIPGIILFLLANGLQFWSHRLLSLLSQPIKQIKGSKYLLPHGGPFELITCPHYSAEILIYLGLSLICWNIDSCRRIGSLLVLTWVAVNLVLAAEATQRWYAMEVGEALKKKRWLKRLIPFVW